MMRRTNSLAMLPSRQHGRNGREEVALESWPTIEEIERGLRKLGCSKDQVKRHLDQVAMSRIEAAKPNPRSKGR